MKLGSTALLTMLALCVGCAQRGTGSDGDDGKGDGTDTGTDDKDDGKDGDDDRPPPGDDGGDGGDPDEPEPERPECGNGEKEIGEGCDGNDFGGLTCVDLGYYGGELLCVECKIDTDGCVEPPPDTPAECGNNDKEPGEQCDGESLGGLTCVDLGYWGGELGCTEECTFDEEKCQYERPDPDDTDPDDKPKPEDCGNGQLDPGETCDGGVGDLTCEELGFEGGELYCGDWCFLDTSRCW